MQKIAMNDLNRSCMRQSLQDADADISRLRSAGQVNYGVWRRGQSCPA